MRLNQPIGFLASCLQARTASVSIRGIRLLTLAASREYATQTSLGGTSTTKPRKAVTVVNDDGRVKWGDLSLGEKAARTTQQTFNLGIILAGLVLTVRLKFNSPSTSLLTSLGRSWLRAVL